MRGVGEAVKMSSGADCHRRQILNLESSGEGVMIGKARKAGRGHLEEKHIIHPVPVLQPRWWTVVGKSEVCTWIYYSGCHDMVFVQ